MTDKLLIEHHLEFLSLKGGCTGSSESTLVKMLHCWKSHVTAHFLFFSFFRILDFLNDGPSAECCRSLLPDTVCIPEQLEGR